jgi:hypothetical protein
MFDHTITIEVDGTEYEVEFEFEASYTPANFSGHPDNWTPSEGECDQNIYSIYEDGEDVSNSMESELRSQIEVKVREWVEQNGVQYLDDYNEECRGEAMIDAQRDYDDDPRDDYAWDGPY